MKLTATRRFKYATRQLVPGDDFEAPSMIARALIGVKKARSAEAETPRPTPPPVPPVDDERERLRDEAAGLGVEVDGRWGIDRLREEIEAHVARSVPRYEAPPEPRHEEPAEEEPKE